MKMKKLWLTGMVFALLGGVSLHGKITLPWRKGKPVTQEPVGKVLQPVTREEVENAIKQGEYTVRNQQNLDDRHMSGTTLFQNTVLNRLVNQGYLSRNEYAKFSKSVRVDVIKANNELLVFLKGSIREEVLPAELETLKDNAINVSKPMVAAHKAGKTVHIDGARGALRLQEQALDQLGFEKANYTSGNIESMISAMKENIIALETLEERRRIEEKIATTPRMKRVMEKLQKDAAAPAL